jgi:ABC-type uncharacterized transport system auxiliary subunit
MENHLSRPQCIGKHWIVICVLIIASSSLITGCVTGGKPQYTVDQYLISYPSPPPACAEKLATSIRFNRFSSSAAYNSSNMIFRNEAYVLDSFNYSRWAVNPADMVSDSLLADIRNSGLFAAVFSRYDTDEARFLLSGSIEEFFLNIDQKGKAATIAISISVQDTREKEIGKRMMFQKKYSRQQALTDASPRGYCQAASLAMQSMSGQITGDIYTAVKNRMP